MKRRPFLTTLGLTAAACSRISGANSRLGVALVGTGRRGRLVTRKMLDTVRVEVRSLCDVWDVQRQRAREALELGSVHETSSLEEVLARPDIDAVVLATPDHLHKEYAVRILESGRHLFLEKPATLHYQEGEEIARAVEKSGRVCQTGTQQRSGSHYREAKERFFGDRDVLGEILFVRTYWSDFGWQRRVIEDRPKPEGFDWERFLGPAPQVPYEWARYDAWRCYRDYGGGILSDLLTHWADVAQWFLDDPNPLNAVATGGIYHLEDGRSNPDTVNAILQYRGWNLTYESTILPVKDESPGVLFHGLKGKLEVSRSGYLFTPHKGEPESVVCRTDLDLEHVTNFLDAIEGDTSPSAGIQAGLQAVKPAHLAVAAYWSGKRMGFNADQSQIVEVEKFD